MHKSPFIRSGGVKELENYLIRDQQKHQKPTAADARAGA